MDNYEFIRRHKVNTDGAEESTENNAVNSAEQTDVTVTADSKNGKKVPKEKKVKEKKIKEKKVKEKPVKEKKTKSKPVKESKSNSPVFEFRPSSKTKEEFDFPVPDNADFDYDWDGENLIPLNKEVEAVVPVINNKTAEPAPVKKEKKKSNSFFATPIFWLLFGFGIVIIAGITLAATFLPKRISPRDLIDVSFEGVEGHGSCVVKFNEERIKKRLPKYYSELIKSEYYSDYTNDWSVPFDELDINTDTSLYDILSSLYITVDPDYELSNNDKITISFDYDNDYLSESYNLRFVGEASTEIVTGLGNGKSINPFEDFHISFTGVNGLGTAEYSYTGTDENFDDSCFSVDPMDYLTNGDTVTVSLYYDEEYLLEQGFVVLQSEKTYTVSGLTSFVESYSELSEDFITKLKAEAQDVINSYAKDTYTDLYNLGELSYVGNAMGSILVPDESMDSNMLYMVYTSELTPVKAEAPDEADKTKNKTKNKNSEPETDDSEDMGPVTVYYPVLFTNIKPSGNSFEYDGTPLICGDCSLPDGTASSGYDNAGMCYYEIMEVNQTDYDMTANDGFDQFADAMEEDSNEEADTEETVEETNDVDKSASSSSSSSSGLSKVKNDDSSSSSSSSTSSTKDLESNTEEEYEREVITSISDIPGDFLSELEDAALSTVNDYISIEYPDKLNVEEPVYLGEYLLRSKSNPDDNILYCVYSIMAETLNENEDSEPFEIFLPVKFTGVTINKDGDYIYNKNEGILGISDIPNSSVLSTKGFVKESQMYNEIKNSSYELELNGLTDDFSYEEN